MPTEWKQLCAKAHLVTFGEKGREKLDRSDFALLVFGPGDELGGYFTCKEMDSETLYIQHGGVFPNFSKTVHVMKGYQLMINWAREHFKNVWTRIENKNTPMLKMALQVGFIPTGTTSFGDKLFIEMSMEVSR